MLFICILHEALVFILFSVWFIVVLFMVFPWYRDYHSIILSGIFYWYWPKFTGLAVFHFRSISGALYIHCPSCSNHNYQDISIKLSRTVLICLTPVLHRGNIICEFTSFHYEFILLVGFKFSLWGSCWIWPLMMGLFWTVMNLNHNLPLSGLLASHNVMQHADLLIFEVEHFWLSLF